MPRLLEPSALRDLTGRIRRRAASLPSLLAEFLGWGGPEAVRRSVDAGATFDVFLSHKRQPDALLAIALERALQRFARPWYRRRMMRVFRDQTILPTGPDLGEALEKALDQSRFFLLIASPESAMSPWVEREARHWLRTHGGQPTNVLLAVARGKLPWEDGTEGLALPPALSGAFVETPYVVDLRDVPEPFDTLRSSDFRDGVAALMTMVLGIPKEDLVSEEKRQHRIAVRLRRAAAAALCALTAASTVAGGVAMIQRADALQQRQVALEQRDTATSGQLAAESQLKAAEDPQLAALLGVAAYQVKPTDQARAGMLTALERAPRPDYYLVGDGRPVRAIAASPDGRYLASGNESGLIVLWDVARHARAAELQAGGSTAISALVFAPDGRTLYAAQAGLVLVFDVARRARAAGIPLQARLGPQTLAISPDGRTLAIGGVNLTDVVLWDISKHVEVARLVIRDPSAPGSRAGQAVSALAFGPNGWLAADDGPNVAIWQTAQPALAAQPTLLTGGHTRGVFSIAFSPDGTLLASGGHDAMIVLWDLSSKTPVAKLAGHTSDVDGLAFSPDGRTLATAGRDHLILLWEVAQRTRIAVRTGHTAPVDAVVFLPGSHEFASAGEDGNVVLWGSQPQSPLRLGSIRAAGPVALSPNGRLLAATNPGGTLGLWETASGSLLGSLGGSPAGARMANAVAFSPDSRELAVAAMGGGVVLWDAASRQPLVTLADAKGPVAFSPDGRTLASGGGAGALLWDVGSGRQIAAVPSAVRDAVASSVAFGPDGRLLAAAFFDRIVLWDVAVGAVRTVLEGQSPAVGVGVVAFSPDGRTLASGASGSGATSGCGECNVILWDVGTASQLTVLHGHAYAPSGLAFSPDGQILATVGGNVLLWSVGQRALLTTLTNGPDSGAAFSGDGRRLATAGASSLELWDMDPASWRRQLCAIAGRDLTRAEWSTYLPGRPYRTVCISPAS